jgi:hypothetical protein
MGMRSNKLSHSDKCIYFFDQYSILHMATGIMAYFFWLYIKEFYDITYII